VLYAMPMPDVLAYLRIWRTAQSFLKDKTRLFENCMRQGPADRLGAQDRRRFEEIFLPYLDAAFNLARWIVQNDQGARDVVQDAYVRAFKGFHCCRGENPRAWFLTITRKLVAQ
jgi:hypothetical protein